MAPVALNLNEYKQLKSIIDKNGKQDEDSNSVTCSHRYSNNEQTPQRLKAKCKDPFVKRMDRNENGPDNQSVIKIHDGSFKFNTAGKKKSMMDASLIPID